MLGLPRAVPLSAAGIPGGPGFWGATSPTGPLPLPAPTAPELLAEEIPRIPRRPLLRIRHQLPDARPESGHARGVAVLDRQARVIAGLVVAVAQEPGHCQLRVLAGVGADHAAHQVDGRDAGAHEGVLVAAHEHHFFRER